MIIGILGEGKMGQAVKKVAAATEDIALFPKTAIVTSEALHFSKKPDVLIDFSHPDNLAKILAYEKEQPTPIVMATTGYTEKQLAAIQQLSSEVPLLKSANFSLGVLVVNRLLKEAATYLADFDLEIIESHHRQKEDAPSGTALLFANTLKESLKENSHFVYGRQGKSPRQENEIGIHAVRGGTLPGKHEILFAGNDETITITHEAYSRDIFATGALKGAQWLVLQPTGFYTMEDCLFGGK